MTSWLSWNKNALSLGERLWALRPGWMDIKREKRHVWMALLLKTGKEALQPLLHQHGRHRPRETLQSKGCLELKREIHHTSLIFWVPKLTEKLKRMSAQDKKKKRMSSYCQRLWFGEHSFNLDHIQLLLHPHLSTLSSGSYLPGHRWRSYINSGVLLPAPPFPCRDRICCLKVCYVEEQRKAENSLQSS